MLSMYKANPEFVTGFSLVLNFNTAKSTAPLLFFQDFQGRSTDMKLLRLGAVMLMALTHF